MTFLKLMARNLRRNLRRSTLAALAIGVAVFVVTSVMAVEAGFRSLANPGDEALLNVYERNVACALTSRVPDSYLPSVRALPSVSGATGVLRSLYTYQRKENIVQVEGVDFRAFRALVDVRLANGSEADFAALGDGALVGQRLAQRLRWTTGQSVSLVEGLNFRVAGIFASADPVLERVVLLHKNYLGSQRREEGMSTYLIVRVSDAGAVAPVSKAIDGAFGNYPRPTMTQSQRATREQQSKDYETIRLMLAGMVLATLLASLVGAANTVSMSVRERTREVGILRSLGFRRHHVLGILAGESMLLALLGGLLGLAASASLLSSEKALGGVVPVILGGEIAAIGMGLAALIGLLGAIVPATVAAKTKIVDTLRVVD